MSFHATMKVEQNLMYVEPLALYRSVGCFSVYFNCESKFVLRFMIHPEECLKPKTQCQSFQKNVGQILSECGVSVPSCGVFIHPGTSFHRHTGWGGAMAPLGKISAGHMSQQGNTSYIALERKTISCSQIDFLV